MENSFIWYLLEVNVVFVVLYLFYKVVLARLTFFNANRAVLLGIIPLSLIIPFLEFGLNASHIMPNFTETMLYDEFPTMGSGTPHFNETSASGLNIYAYVILAYSIGVLIYFSRLLNSIFQIIKLKRRSDVHMDGQFSIIKTNLSSIFSCFKWIFIPGNEGINIDKSIIEHEKLHARAFHTFDLCITEVLIASMWFNPFVYFFRKDLKIIHEYQVDAMLIANGVKKSDYLQLVLDHLLDSHQSLNLCNYFNDSTIKKRIKMITKYKSSKWSMISYSMILPIVLFLTMSFAVQTINEGDVPSISPIKISEYHKVSSSFGMRMHPVHKVEKFHAGIDIAAKLGTNIMATADGVITTLEYNDGGYGKMIKINHGGGYETLYSQMNDYNVKLGDKVKQGDVIGFVGSSGLSTNPHLHYEVRKDGKPVNPQDYINE